MSTGSDRPTDPAPLERDEVRFWLHFPDQDFPLVEGVVIVGRDATSDLVLDDPALLPHHARLVVTMSGIALAGLGEDAPVSVNGQRILSEAWLSCGDIVGFGPVSCEVRPGEGGDRTTLVDSQPPSTERAGTESFEVLASLIDKAIAMNQADDISLLAAGRLDRVAEQCEAGQHVAAGVVFLAARSAVRLAAVTARGSWVNVLLRIYLARREVLPVELIEPLYDVLRRAAHVDWGLLRRYVGALGGQTSRMTPTQRFAARRIEGLLGLGPG